ncbi:hypothetical protein [Klebsiella aerogenes]|uniref:hypothetical protein n=2 Tax=Klebsiella aerogenes TaxID=548 RepID=UPI000DA11730|nr:hypothetical protein [Klebsiella aerogenes]HCB2859830.1 hypothetical protein [Klebsiella aerogenes]HCB2864833.1 hypothetical protein [Klebsiella aerogenes]HCB2880495.1 hypothetical protein [Klebsiella aerogenes]HCB3345896.1 hypothetical protein [Klebsiella aerogenes]HCM1811898.1 hypothetical protein [Klebsiella aerogenes]
MVTKLELEKDAQGLLESLNRDYEIPSSWVVSKFILKCMSVVYVMFILAFTLNSFAYSEGFDIDFLMGLLIYGGGACLLLTGVAFVVLYGHVTMMYCIDREVLRRSIIIKIIKNMLISYSVFLILFNFIMALILIFVGDDYIIGYGLSWFASFLLASMAFSLSIGRYMTPAVTATLSKVGDILSSKNGGEKTL